MSVQRRGVAAVQTQQHRVVVLGEFSVLQHAAPSEARRIFMKDERNERAKRNGWVSLVVDVAVCSSAPSPQCLRPVYGGNSRLPLGRVQVCVRGHERVAHVVVRSIRVCLEAAPAELKRRGTNDAPVKR